MTPTDSGVILLSLFLAGLASSLHCIAMCGPLLAAFSRSMGDTAASRRSLMRLWLPYHSGRLWTYGALGFVAGLGTFRLRRLDAFVAVQRPLTVALAMAVLAVGLVALGVVPGLRKDWGLSSCLLKISQSRPWLQALLRDSRTSARLLLGAILGLLPCAMVYGALVLAAALPSPLHSALGMICFGLGTLPSLSAVLLGNHLAWVRASSHKPRQRSRGTYPWLRRQGPRLVGWVWIVAGLFILFRVLLGGPGSHEEHGGALVQGQHPESRASVEEAIPHHKRNLEERVAAERIGIR